MFWHAPLYTLCRIKVGAFVPWIDASLEFKQGRYYYSATKTDGEKARNVS